jgi:hypothetical protein
MNYNAYFGSFSNFQYVNAIINSQNSANVVISGAVGLSVCQGGSITNCVAYSNPTNCTQCATNYFLLNNTCWAFPLPVIFGCTTYSSLTVCTNCRTGFYLNQNQCVAITPITSCVIYSTTVGPTTCLQCDATTFLAANACTARDLSLTIQNCQTLTTSADTCDVCATGYYVTDDKKNCLAVVPNCATYASGTTLTTVNLVCTACVPTYYLVTANGVVECVQGTILNCATFAASADTCTTCANGFYLANNICVAHINIPSCQTYHATIANTCGVCTTGHYNFKYNQICNSANLIPNCISYSLDGLTCTACGVGYYLDSNACTIIPAGFPNCLTFSGTDCTSCSSRFMINNMVTPKVCVAAMDYLTVNCVLATPSGVATWAEPPGNPLVCEICGPNMRAYSPTKSEAVCVLTTQLSLYSGFTTVASCIRYGLSYAAAPTIICMACISGNFISGYKLAITTLTSTTCVSSCVTSAGMNVILPDDLLGFANVCVATTSNSGQFTATNCGKIVRTTTKALDSTDFLCGSANSGNVVSYVQGAFIDYETNLASATDYKTTSADYFHGFSLADIASNTVVPQTLNLRGLKLTVITLPTLVIGVFLTNCDVVWTIGGGVAKGSAYRTGGGSSGAYTILTGAQAGCFRCKFGFRPQFTVQAPTGNLAIPNCVTMGSSCLSSTTVFGGLPTYLGAVVSCHSCGQINGANTFPTIYLEVDATAGSATPGIFLQFSLPTAAAWTANSPQGFRCDIAPTTVTIANTVPGVGTQVSNCAVYGVFSPVTTTSTDPTPAATASFCLACATGYFPIYFSSNKNGGVGTTTSIPPYAVVSCTQSNKCDSQSTNTPFNSCGRCTRAEESLPSPNFYAYSDFRLINCLPVNTRNCFIISTANSPTLSASVPNTCGVCISGFFLNEDKVCESLTAPNQLAGSSFVAAYFVTFYIAASKPPALGFDAIPVRIHYQLSFQAPQYGVTACNNGYSLAVPSNRAASVCFASTYISTGSFPQNTFFIPKCLQYFYALNANKLNCQRCQTGFIPTSNFLNCVTVLPNCIYAQTDPNSAKCAHCAEGYRNINGDCATSVIANCQSYNNNQGSFVMAVLTCNTCAAGFYKSTDQTTCTVGKVLNCQTYTAGSATACTACVAGFMKLIIASSLVYCYPIPASLNCVTLADQSSSTINNAQITCTQCLVTASKVYGTLAWNAGTMSAQAQTMCMPFNLIPNCATYSQSSTTLASNSFACATCANGYYLENTNKVCILRVVLPANCTTYNPSADLCTACSGNTFLAISGLRCTPYPTGIFNCLVYRSNTTCSRCASGSYLSGNQCLTSMFVSNCDTYSGNNVCSACLPGYFLQNPTTCVKATATGCLNYTSVTVCAACPVGSFKTISGGNTNCVAANVPNCAVINATNTSATCAVCNSGYFVDATGVCQAVPAPIANCQTYANNVTCSVCAAGSVLNPTGTQCMINGFASSVDPNCAQSAVSSTPLCAACALGYRFVNGTCTACDVANLASGCWSCDPNNSTICLICMTGYYQTASGSCQAISLPPNNTPTIPASEGRMVALAVAILSTHLIFW